MTSTATHTIVTVGNAARGYTGSVEDTEGRTCAITGCYPFAEAAEAAARWLASTIEGETL